MDIQEEASLQLTGIVNNFNVDLRHWTEKYGFGANFKFSYEPASGRKFVEVLDLAPLPTDYPKDLKDARVVSAGEVIKSALEEVTNAGSGESGRD